MLSDRCVDSILTDLMMRGMDGFEYVVELRRGEATARTLVVVTGVHLSSQEKQRLEIALTAILEKAAA